MTKASLGAVGGAASALVIGIFVGGAGKRMGGVKKGLLPAPGAKITLLERLLELCRTVGPEVPVYLVGDAAEYAEYGLHPLADAPPGVGPIGGLRSLFIQARRMHASASLALACDLPFIDERALIALTAPLEQKARVPVVEGKRQPLAALYASEAGLDAVDRCLASDRHALQHVIDELGSNVETLLCPGPRALAFADWDTPEDMHRYRADEFANPAGKGSGQK